MMLCNMVGYIFSILTDKKNCWSRLSGDFFFIHAAVQYICVTPMMNGEYYSCCQKLHIETVSEESYVFLFIK